jgi:Prealbumin-like fold domain
VHTKHKRALVAGLLTAATVAAIGGSAEANLSGSTFEGNDGNYVVNTTGNTDWVNAPHRVIGNDLSTGQGDSSFGGGTSENDTVVKAGFGSIPNNKADLSQFLVSSEQGANGNTYLYLGWTRNNQGGTTNFDFEINKLAQPDLTTSGTKQLNRSTGDLLVNYLFQGQIGNDQPVVEIRTWTATSPTTGSWSAPVANVVAEAAISTDSQDNPFGSPNPVPIGQFGETAIDLTASGIIPGGSCVGFSSAYVKTRASTAFTSELKDYVPPQHVDINTCASITVDKVTIPSGSTQSFHFNASYDADGFDLTDAATPNDSGQLSPGTYSVSEDVPANWELTSATCSDGSPVSAIVLSANEHVTCTFTDTLLQGAIKVTKTAKHAAGGPGDHPQSGVSFTVNGVTKQTDANGVACFDGLNLGTYTVTETVPTGYVSDDDSQDVVVDNAAKCADATYVGESVSFHNTPLTNVTVSVDSQVDGGTASTVECEPTDADPDLTTGANGDGAVTISNLQPQTLVCTIIIDP